MDEVEWLACNDPYPMLAWLHSSGKVNRRRLGLFFAACCGRIQPSIAEVRSGSTAYPDWEDSTSDPMALTGARFHLFSAVVYAMDTLGCRKPEHAALATLLRDILGPLPFRPVTVNPAWRTPHVLSLAQAAYEEHILPTGTLDPARLAVLADALEDADCDNAELLEHLRGPGPHVRGCWAVDTLLDKA